MPYVENLFSHEVLLQPIPSPPRLQEATGLEDNSLIGHALPGSVPALILKPRNNEIESRVDWLSVILGNLVHKSSVRVVYGYCAALDDKVGVGGILSLALCSYVVVRCDRQQYSG
ncbi:hypothetical protein QCA50_008240 [Cerrena zonata]|uniref:Uncharacterized protein n=1 Tax=Cerrena zonata TaxID=2478898 RepID=A0AAW0G8F6_9APHY